MARAGPSSHAHNPSTSSGQQYARSFCNTFWGSQDAGVPVLLSHLRSSTRTTDDLRNFWRERALIEEEYANKLGELAGMVLGRDECGELRTALQTLSTETLKISTSHLALSSQIRLEMLDPTSNFLNRQIEFRRNTQAPLEKKFKNKTTQDGYVTKAREKYLGDCVRIEGYQSQLSTAPSLSDDEREKLLRKLATAQQTVQLNERDYSAFLEDYKELSKGWNAEWRGFCDSAQDLDEERIEFFKDIMWGYANAVSTVCVNDDLACESIRTALDQLEPTLDVETYIQEFSTGSFIPDPPEFVPYSSSPAGSSSASASGSGSKEKESGTTARFTRKSKRSQHHHHHTHQGQHQHPVGGTQPLADVSNTSINTTSSSIYTNANSSRQTEVNGVGGERGPPSRVGTPANNHPTPSRQNSAPQNQNQNQNTPPQNQNPTPPIVGGTGTNQTQTQSSRGGAGRAPTPPTRTPSLRQNPATARRESVPLPVPSIPHHLLHQGAGGEYTPVPSSVATMGGMSALAGAGGAGGGFGSMGGFGALSEGGLGMGMGGLGMGMGMGEVGGGGNPILFYVKALYDYRATIEEEFSFQTNDIIAVFATPDDGWWSGELLDEER